VRIAGLVLLVLGAVLAVPALSVPLVWGIEELFRPSPFLRDPYHLVRSLCFVVAALGACVAGLGALMVWVGRPEKR
jgi:hypothetical protein